MIRASLIGKDTVAPVICASVGDAAVYTVGGVVFATSLKKVVTRSSDASFSGREWQSAVNSGLIMICDRMGAIQTCHGNLPAIATKNLFQSLALGALNQ